MHKHKRASVTTTKSQAECEENTGKLAIIN